MFMDDDYSPLQNANTFESDRLQALGFGQQDENQHRRFSDGLQNDATYWIRNAGKLRNAYAPLNRLREAQDYAATVRSRYKRMQVKRVSEHDDPTMPAWLENGR